VVEFHDVHPPLAQLNFRNEGLWPPQSSSCFGLSKPSFESGGSQLGQKFLVLLCIAIVQVREPLGCFFLPELFSLAWIFNPSWGSLTQLGISANAVKTQTTTRTSPYSVGIAGAPGRDISPSVVGWRVIEFGNRGRPSGMAGRQVVRK
jgi:hypothetical protein